MEGGEYGGGVDVGRDRGRGVEVVLAHREADASVTYISVMLGGMIAELYGICRSVGRWCWWG
jgi:hypothetical protein